jgi:hypothetical protein
MDPFKSDYFNAKRSIITGFHGVSFNKREPKQLVDVKGAKLNLRGLLQV